ncbi:MAG: nickel pincer cofactor biosynthesis protein LarB [Candidatus Abyssobacteria bacterium SURF_17]|uniref:Nickel pincer cofactor biosynthesis protein LarB n=1 Tax=Candidatus Abyssobacteria bacterium SURF_17 TaxID=2093361 RepID=A0A419F1I9_9BACT|nr:MAG: nickel pincer cofactor biosynthesis protein LarB [Candidatus Abyssubacteria bacterium SURF_17]
MHPDKLRSLLSAVARGTMRIEEAMSALKSLPYEDLGFAKLDHHRHLRRGFPEVILCESKTSEQIVAIVNTMVERECNVLATRISVQAFESVRAIHKKATYNRDARTMTIIARPIRRKKGDVTVITAGTSDIPVAEEAAVTVEMMGCRVTRVYDVGVAGIHRLFDRRIDITKSDSIVVAAGMEGALASVVGGLVECPVVAVPTSVGYGASFGGLAALLGMLNTCSPGVSVVNIDNGFGAGYVAGLIARRK